MKMGGTFLRQCFRQALSNDILGSKTGLVVKKLLKFYKLFVNPGCPQLPMRVKY